MKGIWRVTILLCILPLPVQALAVQERILSQQICRGTALEVYITGECYMAGFRVGGRLNGPYVCIDAWYRTIQFTRFYWKDTIVSERRYYRSHPGNAADSIVTYRSYMADGVNQYYEVARVPSNVNLEMHIDNLICTDSGGSYTVYSRGYDRREWLYEALHLADDDLRPLMDTWGFTFGDELVLLRDARYGAHSHTFYLNLMEKRKEEEDSTTYLMHLYPVMLFGIRVHKLLPYHRQINYWASRVRW